jgi:hypothetical protein
MGWCGLDSADSKWDPLMGSCEHSNVFHKRAAKQVLACQRYNMRLFNEPYRLRYRRWRIV